MLARAQINQFKSIKMHPFRFVFAFFAITVSLYAEDGIIVGADSADLKLNMFAYQSRRDYLSVEKAITPPSLHAVRYATPVSKLIIPAVCISYGALTQVSKPLQQFDKHIETEVRKHFTKCRHFDDFLQYAPVSAVYGLDFVGVKAKHNFRDRTFVVITSYLIMGGTVQTIKNATGIERPDGSNRLSFPSGHTATAFVGAHILYKEYRDVSTWIGVAGYAAATTVGAMRILNQKHWFSDVVAGAGFGILSAEIGYILLPLFHQIIGVDQNQSTLAIAPMIGTNQYGLGMVWVF